MLLPEGSAPVHHLALPFAIFFIHSDKLQPHRLELHAASDAFVIFLTRSAFTCCSLSRVPSRRPSLAYPLSQGPPPCVLWCSVQSV